jgi:hypothetical protein
MQCPLTSSAANVDAQTLTLPSMPATDFKTLIDAATIVMTFAGYGSATGIPLQPDPAATPNRVTVKIKAGLLILNRIAALKAGETIACTVKIPAA